MDWIAVAKHRDGWRKWKDNIKIDIQKAIFGGTDWIALAKHRDGWRAVVNAVMKLRVP